VLARVSLTGKGPVTISYCQGLDPVCSLADDRGLPLPAFLGAPVAE
jgi:hypothetical protein